MKYKIFSFFIVLAWGNLVVASEHQKDAEIKKETNKSSEEKTNNESSSSSSSSTENTSAKRITDDTFKKLKQSTSNMGRNNEYYAEQTSYSLDFMNIICTVSYKVYWGKNKAEIGRVYTSPNMRNKGYATQAVKAIVTKLKDKIGCSTISVDAHAEKNGAPLDKITEMFLKFLPESKVGKPHTTNVYGYDYTRVPIEWNKKKEEIWQAHESNIELFEKIALEETCKSKA